MSEAEQRQSDHPLLDAVRAATRHKGQHPLPELNEEVIRNLPAGADLVGEFCARAEALGVTVQKTSASELRGTLDELVREDPPAVVDPTLVQRFDSLQALGSTDGDDDTLFAAGCGVTGVEYAIAETGSFVVASGPEKWRQFSFVPPVHIAVIEEKQIVADLFDVLQAYSSTSLPANFVVTTGPSRTADIAQRLVQGVHGPVRVSCVLVE